MKKVKKVLVICLSAVLIMTSSLNTEASYVYTGSSVTTWEWFVTYRHYIYKDPTRWYVMFSNMDICPPVYHTQNHSSITLSYSISISYSSQTAVQFANQFGCTVSSQVIELTTQAGYGITQTESRSYAATGGVAATIPYDAPTGYYKMTLCHDFNSYRFDKYKDGQTDLISSDTAGIPYGVTYLAVLYSPSDSGSGYTIYG